MSDGLEAFDGHTRRAAAEGMFNSEQLGDMRFLSRLPAEKKCSCGWYEKGKCPHCKPPAEEPTTLCRKCGLCCVGLIIEATELDAWREPRIAAECKELKGMDGPVWSIACGPENPCPFHLRDRTCEIYPTRPNACVGFEPGGEQCREVRARASASSACSAVTQGASQ